MSSVLIFIFSLLLGLELFDSLLADGADVGHVTKVFVKVQSIPDHKLVGDLKGNVVWGVAITLKCRKQFSECVVYQLGL
jgi:hypothetical protein